MSGFNQVILLGYLGSDPELRYTKTGIPVANFRMATSKSWVDDQKQRQEKTEWHSVVAWNKLAELCSSYLGKGRQAHVVGELQTREWTDDKGVKRWTTEIVAREVTFVGSSNKPAVPPPSDEHAPNTRGSDRAARDAHPDPGADDILF